MSFIVCFAVYNLVCSSCNAKKIYDGCEDALLRMQGLRFQGFLIHHEVLKNYMLYFLRGHRYVVHFVSDLDVSGSFNLVRSDLKGHGHRFSL